MEGSILDWTRRVLTATPAHWTALCQGLPVALLALPPAPAEWSALECLQHLLDTERWVFPARVQAFLDGKDFTAFNPEKQGSASVEAPDPSAMAAEFASLRQGSLALLETLVPSDLARRARHSELGLVSLDELLHEWAAHDLMHTVQAERALMQPFIRGSGPWQVYFKDHLA